MLNDDLIKQLKSELSLLRAEWKEADEAREYALAAIMALNIDDSDDMALALSEFKSTKIRLEAIEDDIAFLKGDIAFLEGQIKEEGEKEIVND